MERCHLGNIRAEQNELDLDMTLGSISAALLF